MLDFLMISTRNPKKGVIEVYPKFIIKKSSDLFIRGGDFYAIWVEERGLWSTDEDDANRLIDKELDIRAEEVRKNNPESYVKVLHMWDSDTGMIDHFHKYCQRQMRDNYHMLDEELIFSNVETKKEDYASKRLPYPLEKGPYEAWDKLVGTLYSEGERHKIEWAIGSIVCGDSKELQKFLVFYGDPGSGKGTILKIIGKLFKGYCEAFDAKALGSSNNVFALEAFKSNPLVAIEEDGDLSRIEDNTRLNSLVSHELMTVNEKFKSTYSNRFKAFLFMGTNKPVKITDAKSGLMRRLIDVSPSGKKISAAEYRRLFKQVDFELGAIASHCQDVYLANPDEYDTYVPTNMLGASNDFYNYVIENYSVFLKNDSTTKKAAWELYKSYCEEAKVPYPYSQRVFMEELKNYFWEFHDRYQLEDGTRVRSYYLGFRKDKFFEEEKTEEPVKVDLIDFNCTTSLLDNILKDCPAQYANNEGTPSKAWNRVKTKMSEIDSRQVHYILTGELFPNLICIDFDLKDEEGNKSYELNLAAASKWPKTYAELSKSGAGIHLYYLYSGDVSKLQNLYDKDIEIKVFSGKSAIRRKVTKCNDIPIATLSSGLPLKKEGVSTVSKEIIQSEKSIVNKIERALNKEWGSTTQNIHFIREVLDNAYKDGVKYDVTGYYDRIVEFAMNSSNQSEHCMKEVAKMKFKSDEPSENFDDETKPIIFLDVEVFPNLFLICWKYPGKENSVVRLFNPKPEQVEDLIKNYRIIGYNNLKYDNIILWVAMLGYTTRQIYEISRRIIAGEKVGFWESRNVSYTDIYDFASAGNKMSLKKLEIKMGQHHQELGMKWDEPVPEDKWELVAKYCDNDVIATEAAFYYLKSDWTARQILADIAGGTVNDTTNTLTTKLIFGKVKDPQGEFCYRNLGEPVYEIDDDEYEFLKLYFPDMMSSKHEKDSILPWFPGYEYKGGKSYYRGDEIGEGGWVYAEPGIHTNVALLDITSMHPHSMLAECIFGPRYTKLLYDLVYGRVDIKHEDWKAVKELFDGKLVPYIEKVKIGEMKSKDLANALKTAINSVYGLTAASFNNAFRDNRNKDNIVAKRGALFMRTLQDEVQKRGFTVAHIKTDSIKIPNATAEIIQFVMDFGKKYGYNFEHEATYERMCLVNDAVYIAKYADGEHEFELPTGERIMTAWTATGTQFQVPYVFKSLFSGSDYIFSDFCETKSVQAGEMYIDMNEGLGEDEHNYIFIGRVGQFCPIREGHGGGELYRYKDEKYYRVTGTTGYRWLESEIVKSCEKDDGIDMTYFTKLAEAAMAKINEQATKVGLTYEDFVMSETDILTQACRKPLPDFMNLPEPEVDPIPF